MLGTLLGVLACVTIAVFAAEYAWRSNRMRYLVLFVGAVYVALQLLVNP